MAIRKDATSIREAVAIFPNAQTLKSAIAELRNAGFHPEELGLLASAQVVEDALGDLYARTNKDAAAPEAPAIAFVGREAIGEAPSALGGSLFFVGTSGIAGAVVASAAIFGGALLTALGGLVGVGLIGTLVAKVIHQSDAEYLQQQVDEGRILLFARLNEPGSENLAINILNRHGSIEVKVYAVPESAMENASSKPAAHSPGGSFHNSAKGETQ